jgi:hypothetical protein
VFCSPLVRHCSTDTLVILSELRVVLTFAGELHWCAQHLLLYLPVQGTALQALTHSSLECNVLTDKLFSSCHTCSIKNVCCSSCSHKQAFCVYTSIHCRSHTAICIMQLCATFVQNKQCKCSVVLDIVNKGGASTSACISHTDVLAHVRVPAYTL